MEGRRKNLGEEEGLWGLRVILDPEMLVVQIWSPPFVLKEG